MLGEDHVDRTAGVEPRDEPGHKAIGDVLRDQDRHLDVLGESAEHGEQRRRTAG